jgi:hypothetical protein
MVSAAAVVLRLISLSRRRTTCHPMLSRAALTSWSRSTLRRILATQNSGSRWFDELRVHRREPAFAPPVAVPHVAINEHGDAGPREHDVGLPGRAEFNR